MLVDTKLEAWQDFPEQSGVELIKASRGILVRVFGCF